MIRHCLPSGKGVRLGDLERAGMPFMIFRGLGGVARKRTASALAATSLCFIAFPPLVGPLSIIRTH